MIRFVLAALTFVLVAGSATAQSDVTKSVRAAACKWGDAAAATTYLADLCPHLDLTPLAADMFDVFQDHPEFRRCKRRGAVRMERSRPATEDEAKLYCFWVLKEGGGKVVQRVSD